MMTDIPTTVTIMSFVNTVNSMNAMRAVNITGLANIMTGVNITKTGTKTPDTKRGDILNSVREALC